jgi:hypothetical protein
MTNAAPLRTALSETIDRTGHLVSTPAAPLPASKIAPQLRDYQQDGVDDGADCDLAVLLIASRFNLAPHVARLVVQHAGLGGTGD